MAASMKEDSVTVEKCYFTGDDALLKAENFISQYEVESLSSFSKVKTYKKIELPVLSDLITKRIVWEEASSQECPLSFDGVPFFVLGSQKRMCCLGSDRSRPENIKAAVVNICRKADKEHSDKEKRPLIQISRRKYCPASVFIRSVVCFPTYKINKNTDWAKRKRGKQLRADLKSNKEVVWQYHVYVFLPSSDAHSNHLTRETDVHPNSPVSGHKEQMNTDTVAAITQSPESISDILMTVCGQLKQMCMEWMLVYCPRNSTELYHVTSDASQHFLQKRPDILQDFLKFVIDEDQRVADSAPCTNDGSIESVGKDYDDMGDNLEVLNNAILSDLPLVFTCGSCSENFSTETLLLEHIQSNDGCAKFLNVKESKTEDESFIAVQNISQKSKGDLVKCDTLIDDHPTGNENICNSIIDANTTRCVAAVTDNDKSAKNKLDEKEDRIRLENKSGIIQCLKCEQIFPSKQLLKIHLGRSKPCIPTDLSVRNQNLNHVIDYQDDKKNVCKAAIQDLFKKLQSKSGWQCAICETITVSRNNIIRHIIGKHVADRPFQCQYCDRKFKLHHVFNKHIDNHYKKEIPLQKKGEQNPLRKLRNVNLNFFGTCSDCGFSTTNNQAWSTHTCSNKCCDQCGMSFNSVVRLRKHIDSKHNSSLDYKCKNCCLEFTSRSKLFWHKQRRHSVEKHSCRICMKVLSSKTARKTHETMVHHDASKFVCEICGQGFKWKNTFITHRSKHLGEKKYECSFCRKQFNVAETLRVHVQTHQGVKYDCDVCGKTYKYRSSLRTHQKSHNTTSKTESKIVPVKKQHSRKRSHTQPWPSQLKDHKQANPFCCSVKGCGNEFCSQDLLLCHLMAVHVQAVSNGLYVSYTCPLCHQMLADENLMKAHLTNDVNCSVACNDVPTEPVYYQGSVNDGLKHVAQEVIVDTMTRDSTVNVSQQYMQYPQTAHFSQQEQDVFTPVSFVPLC